MRVIFDPIPNLFEDSQKVDFVITLTDEARPEIHTPPGLPPIDRHYLVGFAQSLEMAVEEEDADLVEFLPGFTLLIEDSGPAEALSPPVVLIRYGTGGIMLVSQVDARETKAIMRKLVRFFTGGVRLDIP
jgi:hypothetical protein